MSDINEIFDEIERLLDYHLEKEEKALLAAVKKVEKQTFDIIANLRSGEDNIQARSSLGRAVEYQRQIVEVMAREYGSAVDEYVKNLLAIDDIIKNEYGELDLGLSFSQVDRDTLKTLRATISAEFSELGDFILGEITGPVYDNVLVGGSFSDLAAAVEKILFKDGEGSMAYIARRKVHDTLMNYYQSNQVLAARRTGITDFLYYGNVIKSTRDFCARRAGRIYSMKEIQSWNALNWQGKKPGNVFLNRGGYNCRHTMHPVKKGWINEGRIDVQRFEGR